MYKVIGIMSGTSLDGLDLCLVHFQEKGIDWEYSILKGTTLDYSKEWLQKLNSAPLLSARELHKLHIEYGKYIGKCVKEFTDTKVDLVCSHGHTVFHEAQQGINYQLGHPQAISTECGIKTVGDFRTLDVLLGGEGAPLVPIGDKLLFNEYQACINLGGFSNISFDKGNERLAFDISPVNIVLNHLSKQINMDFDRDGEVASMASVNNELLNELNKQDYFNKDAPKSLGREWVEEKVYPLLNEYSGQIENCIRTYTEHIAYQTAKVLNRYSINEKVLFSGGGAKNKFLIQRINELTKCKIELANEELMDFKEALIFGLLGVLRMENKINVLKSVTGANKNSSCGVVYLPQ